MPAITVTKDLTDPSASLTTGTKYLIQNHGYAPVRMAVSASAITTKTADSLILQTLTNRQAGELQYTHTAGRNIRLWAEGLSEGGDAVVVFVAL